jgi:hypothetical protein
VDLRVGLDDVEKRKFFTLPGLEIRPLGCPDNPDILMVRSQKIEYIDHCYSINGNNYTWNKTGIKLLVSEMKHADE